MIYPVNVANGAFTPAAITATNADAIIFLVNEDGHEIVSDPGVDPPFDAGELVVNETFEIDLIDYQAPATIGFSCKNMPEMKGTIILQ